MRAHAEHVRGVDGSTRIREFATRRSAATLFMSTTRQLNFVARNLASETRRLGWIQRTLEDIPGYPEELASMDNGGDWKKSCVQMSKACAE
jgi:hypothetical protein